MDIYLIFLSCIVGKFPVPMGLMLVDVYLTRNTLNYDETFGVTSYAATLGRQSSKGGKTDGKMNRFNEIS
jgi:hypothetical protein